MSTRTIVFCVLFGIAGPVICVFLDPMVFRVDPGQKLPAIPTALLGEYQAFSYAAIALACVLLTIYLTRLTSRPVLRMALAGGLMGSAAFALALGLALLPYSIMGAMMIIGLLGFTPFFTAWAYARAGLALFKETPKPQRYLFTTLALAAAMAFFAAAAGFQMFANRSMNGALSSLDSPDAATRSASLSTLRRWDSVFGHQRLIAAYLNAGDSRRRALADAYQTLAGRDLVLDTERMDD